ncbi:MAG TPA: ADP-glyceromanno-heptose 6-epimerase [Chitinophagaceae bacterium]|nr:ADP-glyceromanno-heptose 6-epimerase [Chitinophagaceae bacterium]
MNTNSTILITGAAGFIASCMATFLNKKGYSQLILVDDFSRIDKLNNHNKIQCIAKVNRDEISTYLLDAPKIDAVIHFGARTDTTEMNYEIHDKLNVVASKVLWHYCTEKEIPFIYASSAATYGNGELGYHDDHEISNELQPLNPYGVSKNEFDKFVLQQKTQPPNWYGLKFFNVYGPNEYHKGRMASVIMHASKQIKEKGSLKLFKSHHPDYIDGGQMRDFIYVKDILNVTYWLFMNLPNSGIYNLGTGNAASFLQLANAIFHSMNCKPSIEFIDTPIDIREKYQYFTEADMTKLLNAGYDKNFFSIEEGIDDYYNNYLKEGLYY